MVKQPNGSYLKIRLASEPDEVSAETVFLHIGGQGYRDLREYRGSNIKGVKFGLPLWEDTDYADTNLHGLSARGKIKQDVYKTCTSANYSYDPSTGIFEILNNTLGSMNPTNAFKGYMLKVYSSPPKYYLITSNDRGPTEITVKDGPSVSPTEKIGVVETIVEGLRTDRIYFQSNHVYIRNNRDTTSDLAAAGIMTFYDGIHTDGIQLGRIAQSISVTENLNKYTLAFQHMGS